MEAELKAAETACPLEAAKTYYALGTEFLNANQATSAEDSLVKAEGLLPKVKDSFAKTQLVHNIQLTLMSTHATLKNEDGLREAYKKAKSLAGLLPELDYTEDITFANLLYPFNNAEGLKLAEECFEKFRGHSVKYASNYKNATLNLASIYIPTSPAKAIETLNYGLSQLQRYRTSLLIEQVEVWNLLAGIYMKQGDLKKSLECKQQANKLYARFSKYSLKGF